MKFKGTFNYHGEQSELETDEATTELQAWEFFCYSLAKRYGVSISVMKNHFNGDKDNYLIKKDVTK